MRAPTENRTPDARVTVRPLPAPAELLAHLPRSERIGAQVRAQRETVAAVLDGADDRLLVIVGPCSVHDHNDALRYGELLRDAANRLADDLVVVMRCYLEKPRTGPGWPGLLNDPGLDGSGDVPTGIRLARRILLDLATLGLPLACEWLNPLVPEYLADLVCWGAIGARTVESQTHRQLASLLDMPVGLKNRADGCVRSAVHAVRSAGEPHSFPGIGPDGRVAWLRTAGNRHPHVVLRGGSDGPNHGTEHVAGTLVALREAGLPARVVVDASHDNSGKDPRRQAAVASQLADRIAAGERGLRGVLLESFLLPGRQDVLPGRPLRAGQSITDACLGWPETERLLDGLAAAARGRAGRQVRLEAV